MIKSRKLAALVASTALLLSPLATSAASADSSITLDQLKTTAEYKALQSAGAKTISNIKTGKAFSIKVTENLTGTGAPNGTQAMVVEMAANKTAGRVSTKYAGVAGAGIAAGSCAWVGGKYYFDLNPKGYVDSLTSVVQVLKAMKTTKATRAFDSKTYNFANWGKVCSADPKPATLLATITSSNLSAEGILSSIVNSNAQFTPITVKTSGTTKKYTLVGSIVNPEDIEQASSFTVVYTVAKDKSLVGETLTMSQTGMGFDIKLDYTIVSTGKIKVAVATDHAVAASKLIQTAAGLSANKAALIQASLLAKDANASSKKSHKKITSTTLATSAKGKHFSVSKNASGVRVNYTQTYKLNPNSAKVSKVIGHACVVAGKAATAKACK